MDASIKSMVDQLNDILVSDHIVNVDFLFNLLSLVVSSLKLNQFDCKKLSSHHVLGKVNSWSSTLTKLFQKFVHVIHYWMNWHVETLISFLGTCTLTVKVKLSGLLEFRIFKLSLLMEVSLLLKINSLFLPELDDLLIILFVNLLRLVIHFAIHKLVQTFWIFRSLVTIYVSIL